MKYTLRQLEVFIATAHYQNVTKAADSLAMSQSAASGSLRDLEEQFDVKLFDRVGKRLHLNELGQILRPKAEALLEQANELQLALQKHNQPGDLRVGATLTIGNYLAVELIHQYKKRFPDTRVSLEVNNTQTIAAGVLNFDLDLGMIEGDLHHPDLHITPWQPDEMMIFASSSHPLANKKELSDEDLMTEKWILRESGSGTRQAFDWAMHDLLPKLDIEMELQHTEAIKRAVKSGLGISCLSKIALEDSFNRGDFVPLKTPGRDFHRTFYFVQHKEKYQSAGLQEWKKICGLT